MRTECWLGGLKEGHHLEDLGGDRKMILNWISGRRGLKGMYWVHLASYRDQWRYIFNAVMKLSVPVKQILNLALASTTLPFSYLIVLFDIFINCGSWKTFYACARWR
jgi:hypothetical protein